MERDPNGIDPHAPGAKLDAGKPRVGLMVQDFARALEAVAEVTTLGAVKYSPSGWRTVENGIERYNDALMRHQLQSAIEEYDPDLCVLHAASVAWNALARLELILEASEAEDV